ncbi:hypothetical protein [Micromonospora sp. CB01531]|uniref:hypothetical protein n=1 Tax=Micromonospora sp. CB01531 TaxID=1718947 RepID=UPI00093B3533|nr:hypothetical protein [Micromonospora sp. CB01531]OKI45120.1 hypothetical protein A6A27_11950 [Micromonospora sp. CB01531]
MAKVSVTVCDICADRSKEAQRYTIRTEEGTVNLDLCVDDAAPIRQLLTKAKKGPRRPHRTPVTTVEEIEAKKSK